MEIKLRLTEAYLSYVNNRFPEAIESATVGLALPDLTRQAAAQLTQIRDAARQAVAQQPKTATREQIAQKAPAMPGDPAQTEAEKLKGQLAQVQESVDRVQQQRAELVQRLTQLQSGTPGTAGKSASTVPAGATVTGQVGKPGPVEIPPVYQRNSDQTYSVTGFNRSLAAIIGAAGGLTNIGNGAAITVTPRVPDGTVRTLGPLNLNTKAGADFEVQPGDVVNVPVRLF
jgi:hypothetical protein